MFFSPPFQKRRRAVLNWLCCAQGECLDSSFLNHPELKSEKNCLTTQAECLSMVLRHYVFSLDGLMARTPQDITEAELAVLQVLWEQGPATIRRLTDMLYPDGGTAHYATVQKLLERLEAKRCVSRDRSGAVHVFAAAIDRDALIGRRLESLAEKLCGGSWTPLLTHLLQARKLSAADRQTLRALIDELDQQPKPKSERR
jgi:predicted transcriptional regulator